MPAEQSTTRYLSPLRYPGGKGKVANFLKALLIQNRMEGVNYVEPYAGGASVALALLFDGYVSAIHINDLNRGVYQFWRSVLNDPDVLCERINRAPLSIAEWERQRSIYQDPDSLPEEIGFAAFYLNRTNRSGIIPRGGVIGGNEQLGNWKMDARFNRSALCDRVERIAAKSSQITLTNYDAVDLLVKVGDVVAENSLFYLDPPYYVKGSRLYDNFYAHEDHIRVRAAVVKLATPWLVSYDAAPEILSMYSAHRSLRYSLGYSVSGASQGAEVMFFSSGLEIPPFDSPASISTRAIENFRGSRHLPL